MTEEDARAWLADRYGDDRLDRLRLFVEMVVRESDRQNLIAPSTIPAIWLRHVLDSAQLMALVPEPPRTWIDVGTGAGFPGLVAAILSDARTMLIEPRARRAAFLADCAERLGIADRVTVARARAETIAPTSCDVLSARAVASINALLTMTRHLRSPATRILLPRGRSGPVEVEAVRQRWSGMFHVEHSLTDAESWIVVAVGVNG